MKIHKNNNKEEKKMKKIYTEKKIYIEKKIIL